MVAMTKSGKIRQSMGMGRRFIGEILLNAGVIDNATLDQALLLSASTGRRVGQVLRDLDALRDEDIARAISEQLAIPLVDIESLVVPEEVIALVPAEQARNHNLLPISDDDRVLTLLMANPLDVNAIEDIRFITQMPVQAAIATEPEIVAAIDKYYPVNNLVRQRGNKDATVNIAPEETDFIENASAEDIKDFSNKPPIVRFVNAIISDAIKYHASDIHIEPQRAKVVIRYRVDGVMREMLSAERVVHAGVVSRLKILSKMDIAVRRVPQDGKLQVTYGGGRYDLRVSTLPTAYGEKVTIRLLNPLAAPESLGSLDFLKQQLADVEDSIRQPQGLVLLTGPTGSGKTTTLYTCLKELLSPKVNIVTLENPIEYEVEGINQVEINTRVGLTFASGLRSILRQDPDVILLGEIRDAETANIAFHAAQTGHLVLSTLHTNSAAAAVSRLLDLGVDASSIATSLNVIVGQRLVRRICKHCKQIDPLTGSVLATLPADVGVTDTSQLWVGKGCESCNFTGYSGRAGIHEVLRVTPRVQRLINDRASVEEIEKAAVSAGFHTMSTDGILKALRGITTISEIYRVAPPLIGDRIGSDDGRHLPTEEILESGDSGESREEDSGFLVSKSSPQRVLLIDSDEVNLRFLQGILEGEDYRVITERNSDDALSVAAREHPDLIIMDSVISVNECLRITAGLRSALSTSYVPVIVLARTPDHDSEAEMIEEGVDDVIMMPLDARILVARIRRLIKRASSR